MTARVLTILFVLSVDKNTLGTAQFPPGDVLCVEERVIGGGTASILVKGVISMVEEVITRGTAPKGTPDKYRAIDSPVRATSSQSPLIG